MKPVILLAAAVALAVSVPACSTSPDPETMRQALERLAPSRAGEPLATLDPPASYRVSYQRITAASTRGSDGHLRPERLERTVRRPFLSAVKGELQRRLGFEQDALTSVERAVFLRPLPDEPRPDQYHPDASHDAQRNRQVANRECRVFLYDEAEYCIDGSGLVLASRVGTSVEVATKVTVLGSAPTPAEIASGLAVGVSDPARGSVRPLDASSSPPGRTDWSLPTPPEGFTFVGRYAAVPLTGELLNEGSRGITAGVVDVYVRGMDTIVVDRGGKLDLTEATDRNLGSLGNPVPVDLGALGAGRSGIGGIGPFGYREVRATPEKGRYVVVAGTVPVAQLIEIARSLRPSAGATLRYLDNP